MYMKKFLMRFFVILGIGLIAGGVYLNYLGKPQNVFKTFLKSMNSKVEVMLEKNKNSFFRDNFTTTSNIKFDLTSEYFDMLAEEDPDYASYSKLIKNLNNTENTLVITQDKDNKKLLAELTSNLNKEELIKAKYFVESNKQYFFVNKVLDTYFKGGESTYFEALEESLSSDDLEFLYKTMEKSFENNLKDEYFTSGTENSLHKVTLNLNSSVAKELAKAIIKDLKEDSKANKIITGISPDFFTEAEEMLKDKKENNDTKGDVTLENDSSITSYEISIYTDQLTYNLKKYEIISLENNKESQGFSYEIGKDKDLMTITDEGKATGYVEITKENDNYKLNILDKDKKSLATGNIVFTDLRTEFSINYKEESNIINFSYKAEIKNKTENGFDNDVTISLKATSENINIISGTVTINNKVTKGNNEVNEKASNAVELNEQQTAALGAKLNEVMTKLLS